MLIPGAIVENLQSIHLRQIQRRLGSIAYQLTKVQFQPVFSQSWSPPVNAYQCARCILICVDLAGVDKSQIDLAVEPRRILLRGHRRLLAPEESEGSLLQVLAMEIDEGPFKRELVLPAEVDPGNVRAEQRNGVLWIWLPLMARRDGEAAGA